MERVLFCRKAGNTKKGRRFSGVLLKMILDFYFLLSATATATATVAPTMGLLPMPRKPIISTEETAFGGCLIGAQGLQKK